MIFGPIHSAVQSRVAADSDGDGVDDCRDGCPADPLKTDPGRCGCGVSEDECPSECRGLFGFSLATNACFGSDAFGVVVAEVRLHAQAVVPPLAR